MAYNLLFLFGKLVQKVFFGSLRDAETQVAHFSIIINNYSQSHFLHNRISATDYSHMYYSKLCLWEQ